MPVNQPDRLHDNLAIAGMDIPELEAEIFRIEGEEDICLNNLNHTLASEDPVAGKFFAAEIHKLKQDKLRLHVEKEFCRKRIARLQFEREAACNQGENA